MALLIAGLAVFFAVHLFTAVRPARAALIGRVGEGAYKGVYSVLSLLGFALMVWGFIRYRTTEFGSLYPVNPSLRHAAMGLILVAFILLAANMSKGYIRTTVRHPFVLGVALWATAHLLLNGDAGGAVLFGTFLAYCAVFALSLLGRESESLPAPHWRYDLRALIGGVVVFLLFAFVIHPYVFQIPVTG
jgi:uncharacterized membrane protein